MWTLAIIAVLGIAGFLTVRWVLSNSWFVALGDGGEVTIYQGIPEEIGGASFADVEDETGISEDDVPASFVADLEAGKKFESLEEAQQYVDAIEDRIREIEESTEEEQRPDRKRRGS